MQLARLNDRAFPALWRLCVLFLGVAISVAGCDPMTDAPLQHEAYVWQRVWTPAVAQAMEQSKPFLIGWRVLLAESAAEGDWREFSPRISAPEREGKTLTAVIRIDGQRRLENAAELLERLGRLITVQSLIPWSGLEIDYDCPSSSLDGYAEFVRQLRGILPPRMRLSVTVLPTWISSRSLKGLLDAVDSSVLQVHSVLDPHRGLFDAKLANSWLAAYSPLTRKPFSIALPDYGSRVAWTSSGRLASIVSEQSTPERSLNQQELLAKVRDVDGFLSGVRFHHASNLTGIVWFRLPLAEDQRVWSLSTLASVIRGESIVDRRVFRVSRDSAGAYQIELVNDGSIDAPLPRVVMSGPCVAADAFNGYSIVHGADHLLFIRRDETVLRAGERADIGWTRCIVSQEDLRFEDE